MIKYSARNKWTKSNDVVVVSSDIAQVLLAKSNANIAKKV